MNFLHFSDLHFGSKGYTIEQAKNNVEGILKVLETEKIGTIDTVFITGDLIYAKEKKSRTKRNLDKLGEYIEKIISILGVERNNLFIVPGNHDVKRTNIRKKKCPEIKKNYNLENGLSKDEYDILASGFEYFTNMHKNLCEREFNIIPHLDERDAFNILSLNTALVSFKDDEERDLIIDIGSIGKALAEAKTKKPTIAIGHHPIESMHTEESRQLELLFSSNNVQVYLCGHEHQMIYQPKYAIGNTQFKLHQFKCGTLMSQRPNGRETDMLIYAGSIEENFVGYVLPIKWDRRYISWMPDTGYSYCQDKKLDGLIYINKTRDEVIQARIDSCVEQILPKLEKNYRGGFSNETLKKLIIETDSDSFPLYNRILTELITKDKIGKTAQECFVLKQQNK